MKKRVKFYTVVALLVLVEITSVFLMCKSLSGKPTLDDVKLKEIENKDTFAIMLGDKDGVYTESDSNTWPSNKSYTFNSDRSGCIDKDGNKIDNALSFNSETNIATVSVSQTAYCYLYFDIDSVSPQAFTFYLGGSSNPTYTTSTSTTAYLSWTDTDITEICISNTQGSSNCTWQEVSGTSTTVSHILTSGDATKTVYAYLKDEAGNISSEVTDTIILDTTPPTNNSVVINSNASSTNSTNVTLTLASTGATEMCISNTTSCSNYVTYATSYSHTLTSGNGTKTVYVWFRDAAGNTIASYVSDTITLDTIAPTVTASVSGNNSTSAKLSITSNEAGTYCVNTSATASTMTSCVFSGSISANTALTTGVFTTSGTYYAHVKDATGNYGVSSAVSVTVSQPAGEYIQDAAPSGLETTAQNGMYRFVGSSVNNYVSIGGVSYRIIGITSTANSTLGLEAGQLKVIKAASTSIGEYNWHTGYTTDTKWESSAMYTYLNNTVLNNTSYIPSGWSDKIDSVKWYIGDVQSYTNASTIIGLEDDTVTSSTSKIGLMYLSDYYYSAVAGGTTNCVSTECTTSWIYNSSLSQWTMTRYGGSSYYYAWYVTSIGRANWQILNAATAVRPVFYLTSDVAFKSGTGTSSDPFVLE